MKAAVTISQLLHKGYSHDFLKGGYTVSNRGYSLDCHVDLHAMFILMLQIKKLTKGGYRQPRIPPSYALGPAPYWQANYSKHLHNKQMEYNNLNLLTDQSWPIRLLESLQNRPFSLHALQDLNIGTDKQLSTWHGWYSNLHWVFVCQREGCNQISFTTNYHLPILIRNAGT